MSSTIAHCRPSPPTKTIGGEGGISREKRHCLPISRLIWRTGSNLPRKRDSSSSSRWDLLIFLRWWRSWGAWHGRHFFLGRHWRGRRTNHRVGRARRYRRRRRRRSGHAGHHEDEPAEISQTAKA